MTNIASVLRGQAFTATNIIRAINSVWGNIGANRDDRDWTAIMASADPLAASEIALVEMYQNAAYLIRNANSLRTLGYTQNQIVYTYHQLADRLGFTYNADWAIGTAFAETAFQSFNRLRNQAINDYEEQQQQQQNNFIQTNTPTLTLANDAAGFLIQSNLDGQLIFTDGTFIANLTAGIDARFPMIGALKTGQIVALSNANLRSTASTQTVTLGTAGDDIYDGSAINTAQFISTGDGNDTITGGAGADIIYAGDGNDIITGGAGSDVITIAAGTDTITDLGDGADVLIVSGTAIVNATVVANYVAAAANSNTSSGAVTLTGDFNMNMVLAIGSAGYRLVGGASDNTLIGSDFNDTINGGDGADVLTGGAGADTLTGGAGADHFAYAFGAAGETETGIVSSGVIDVITDFTTGNDTIGGFGVAGENEFTSGGGAFQTYAAALAGANNAMRVTNNDYVLTAYGMGANWTAVVFIDIGATGGLGAAAGAIQLGETGVFTSEFAAFTSAGFADFIA